MADLDTYLRIRRDQVWTAEQLSAFPGRRGRGLAVRILMARGPAAVDLDRELLLVERQRTTAGAASYVVRATTTSGDIAPEWTLGLLSGLGGLVGGYLGARLQPHLPERFLRFLLGGLATGLAAI